MRCWSKTVRVIEVDRVIKCLNSFRWA